MPLNKTVRSGGRESRPQTQLQHYRSMPNIMTEVPSNMVLIEDTRSAGESGENEVRVILCD